MEHHLLLCLVNKLLSTIYIPVGRVFASESSENVFIERVLVFKLLYLKISVSVNKN